MFGTVESVTQIDISIILPPTKDMQLTVDYFSLHTFNLEEEKYAVVDAVV